MRILTIVLAVASILFALSLMALGTIWAMYTVMLFFFNDSGIAATPFQLTWKSVGPGFMLAFSQWLAVVVIYCAARYWKSRKSAGRSR